MQDNYESNAKPRFLSEKLFLIIKWIFVMFLAVILYKTFQQKQQNIDNLTKEFSKIFLRKNSLSIITVLSLILVNWACEAKKWQILMIRFEKISFIDAYQSVLVGLTLGFITPASLGDFAGRTLHLKKSNRSAGIGTNLLGNGIQFYVTLIFGISSYLIIWYKNISNYDKIIFVALIFCTLLGIIIFINRSKIQIFTNRFSWIKPYQIYVNSLIEFENQDFIKVFVWTVIRFLTYSFQFVIMLQIFQIDISFINLWAISCLVLLFKTIIPQVNFLGDLGVREFSALHFFSYYSIDTASVIMATFALWIINILLPVLLGSFLFLKIKNTNNSIL